MDMGLDPLTGDYSGQVIDDLGNAVYLRLQTPLGSWWADLTLGSRLPELQREKDVPRIQTLAKQCSEQAAQPTLSAVRAM